MADKDIAKMTATELIDYIAKAQKQLSATRAKEVEPLKKEIQDTFVELKKKAKQVKDTDPDYDSPWDWEAMRLDSKMKKHLIKHGDLTPKQIADALGEKETDVTETLKERSGGDRPMFVKNGDKYGAKPAKSEK